MQSLTISLATQLSYPLSILAGKIAVSTGLIGSAEMELCERKREKDFNPSISLEHQEPSGTQVNQNNSIHLELRV